MIRENPFSLIAAAQNVTAAWVDLGPEIVVTPYTRILLWINLDINDSTNVRIRALGKLYENATLEYNFPIRTVSSAVVTVDDEFIEFDVDADQQMILEVETNGLVPILQFQVQAGVAGAAPGQIDNAEITFSSY